MNEFRVYSISVYCFNITQRISHTGGLRQNKYNYLNMFKHSMFLMVSIIFAQHPIVYNIWICCGRKLWDEFTDKILLLHLPLLLKQQQQCYRDPTTFFKKDAKRLLVMHFLNFIISQWINKKSDDRLIDNGNYGQLIFANNILSSVSLQ